MEELLYDIETLSKDIMELSTQCKKAPEDDALKKPFRSEINLYLNYPNSTTDQNSGIDGYMNQTAPIPNNNEITFMHPAGPLSASEMTFPEQDCGVVPLAPLRSRTPLFSSNPAFCTVSAPTTPAVDRKFEQASNLDKNNNLSDSVDRNKKLKRVSYSNPDEPEGKVETPGKPEQSESKTSVTSEEGKKHHKHSHHSKLNRRLSLDTNQSAGNGTPSKHRNHRESQDSQTKSLRPEISKLKKRSRSESTFNNDPDHGGTSVSERYSNSIASSRESSTSLSSKSQPKRRISITSHGGSSKIPWCACWGNGCL